MIHKEIKSRARMIFESEVGKTRSEDLLAGLVGIWAILGYPNDLSQLTLERAAAIVAGILEAEVSKGDESRANRASDRVRMWIVKGQA
jgi:hypothetical protein